MPVHDPIVEDAYAFLRANTTADLRFDEHLRPIRYVIAPDGRLVASVMESMLRAVDTVLFIPECVEDSMEVQVTLERFDEQGEAGALADRWRIYHGQPQDVRWAMMRIDMARHRSHVIDGEALMRPNALAEHESRICRHMNQDHADDLRNICNAAGVNVERPLMIGIDPLGIDVRREFDVVRIPSPEPMNTPEDARRVLIAMSSNP
jgi:hypothetical protein